MTSIKAAVARRKYSRPMWAIFFILLAGQLFLAGQARAQEATELTNGVAVDVTISQAGGYAVYYIDVSEGISQLTFSLAVSQGELALASALAAEPDPTDPTANLCYEEAGEAALSCQHDNPQAGRWYVLVYGETAGQASLTATYVEEGRLTNDEGVEVSLGETGGQAVYFIDVPANAAELTATLEVASGLMTLHTAFGAEPDPTDETTYDCAQEQAEAGEATLTCQHDSPQAGRWYILVSSEAAAEGEITAAYTLAGGTSGESLLNNVIVPGEAAEGESVAYQMDVPEDSALFKVKVHVVSGGLTVYTKFGSAPTATDYDGFDSADRGNAQIHHHFPSAGTWHILVYGDEASRYWVQGHYSEECLNNCGGGGNGIGGGNGNGGGNRPRR